MGDRKHNTTHPFPSPILIYRAMPCHAMSLPQLCPGAVQSTDCRREEGIPIRDTDTDTDGGVTPYSVQRMRKSERREREERERQR